MTDQGESENSTLLRCQHNTLFCLGDRKQDVSARGRRLPLIFRKATPVGFRFQRSPRLDGGHIVFLGMA